MSPAPPPFPTRRMRRLRSTPALRRLVAETRLSVDDLVAPLFVREGIDEPVPIASMPGVVQHSVASLVAEAKRLLSPRGPRLRPLRGPAHKDAAGDGRLGPGRDRPGGAPRRCATASATRWSCMADLCLDEYTDHGHCGVLDARRRRRQRRHPRAATARSPSPRPSAGADSRRAERDDGRPGGAPSGGPRRGRPQRRGDAGLRGQVRVGVLRPVSRGGRRAHRRRGRPPRLPAGSGQRPGGGGARRCSTSKRVPT